MVDENDEGSEDEDNFGNKEKLDGQNIEDSEEEESSSDDEESGNKNMSENNKGSEMDEDQSGLSDSDRDDNSDNGTEKINRPKGPVDDEFFNLNEMEHSKH